MNRIYINQIILTMYIYFLSICNFSKKHTLLSFLPSGYLLLAVEGFSGNK